MSYWREDFFHDLETAESEARSLGWHQYADYCREQEKGMRARAFAALAQFISVMARTGFPERRRYVSWLASFAHERRGRGLLIPYPLKTQIVEPTLVEWVATEPDNPEPHRWLGGSDHLEQALHLDPSDQIARKKLILEFLSWIEYATHELPAGYLGSVPEDVEVLDKVEALIPELLDEELRKSYSEAVAEERAAIARYVRRFNA